MNLPNGQDEQLELYLGHLAHHVLARETQVDASGIDAPMAQLLLKRIEASTGN